MTLSGDYGTIVTLTLSLRLGIVGSCCNRFYFGKRRSVIRSLFTKCGQMPVDTYEGIQTGETKLSQNIIDLCVELVLALGTAHASLRNQTVQIKT